ncbi:sugar phosphate isomerase/epimerase family protein [Clavibacter tessellarius]|uniref:sugar phosphate isomerase/epimerase family protein n=1 Tax=Clavibacter tessellarius TaxID=31965 RepID=UPI00324F896C
MEQHAGDDRDDRDHPGIPGRAGVHRRGLAHRHLPARLRDGRPRRRRPARRRHRGLGPHVRRHRARGLHPRRGSPTATSAPPTSTRPAATRLVAVARGHGVGIPSVHLQRQSVIMPGHEERNLAYAHRTIDAIAEMGMEVFSTGLHQPFSDAQRKALWFWTAEGPKDPDDPEVWDAAVTRLRELGRHAADLGLRMALEMYEDTYLGTADSAVRLVEEIGLDNVGLNPDVANLIRLHRPVESWRELYAKTLPYANYWHVKNYMRDEAADGSWATSVPTTMRAGLIDYRQVIRDAVEPRLRRDHPHRAVRRRQPRRLRGEPRLHPHPAPAGRTREGAS